MRPAKAPSITARETPAAPASRPMADRNALKSPPHGAAAAGVAKSETQNRIASERNRMPFLPVGEAERHIMAARNKETASRPGRRCRPSGPRPGSRQGGGDQSLAAKRLSRDRRLRV